MDTQYKVLTTEGIEVKEKCNGFALDVLTGLTKEPKSIPFKYFYDEECERLFRRITELPEYYLTDCEFEIFQTYKNRSIAFRRGKYHRIWSACRIS